MDSDNEMLVQMFMEEENTVAIQWRQQRLMLVSLLHLRQPILALAVPRRGSSRVGKSRNKERHHQAGALLLDSDCFADDTTHMTKDFRRRFRMKNDLFMKIVFGVSEYDYYFMCKQDCTGLWAFS
jgi:hypothetical protein